MPEPLTLSSPCAPGGFSSPPEAPPHRVIFHVDLDAFFVSVERVLDPTLVGRPVLVGGSPEGRGVVAAASYEAREFGVHSAMPMAQALRLCPHAIVARSHGEEYRKASDAVARILERYTPLIEWASIDEAYMDVTGTERLFGHPLRVAEEIRQRVEQALHLSLSIGIAPSKLVAKIASRRAKPRGILWIMPGREASFLAPLPADALPGVGPKAAERLRFLGVRRIGDLAALEPGALHPIFGVWGTWMVDRARGEDPSPVACDSQPRSVGRETTFPRDTSDRVLLEEVLFRVAEKVGSRLRDKGLRGRTVTLKLRYADFRTITRSRTLDEPTDIDLEIFRTALSLFGPAHDRRVRVRLLGITLSNLDDSPRQLDLFEPESRRRTGRLLRQVDAVRRKYGYDTVLGARSLLHDRDWGNPD